MVYSVTPVQRYELFHGVTQRVTEKKRIYGYGFKPTTSFKKLVVCCSTPSISFDNT